MVKTYKLLPKSKELSNLLAYLIMLSVFTSSTYKTFHMIAPIIFVVAVLFVLTIAFGSKLELHEDKIRVTTLFFRNYEMSYRQIKTITTESILRGKSKASNGAYLHVIRIKHKESHIQDIVFRYTIFRPEVVKDLLNSILDKNKLIEIDTNIELIIKGNAQQVFEKCMEKDKSIPKNYYIIKRVIIYLLIIISAITLIKLTTPPADNQTEEVTKNDWKTINQDYNNHSNTINNISYKPLRLYEPNKKTQLPT